ncbi:MAG: DUF935 family protein [Magnetococcales bacterium]|nr:DUF935 family protein [Magnetococcales bacterium]
MKIAFDEIAPSRGDRDITLGHVPPGMIRPSLDSVLRNEGLDLEDYEEILRDDQVAATFQQRRLAVTSAEWDVVAGANDRQSRMAADFLRETLQHVGWDGITDKMLYGVFFGFSVSECLWAREGNRIVLDALKVRKQRRFGFDGEGRLRLLTITAPTGELLPERKFWHFSTGTDHDDEPYGLGLAHWLYWPVYFKRNGTQMWMVFLEKFGMPTAMGTFPKTASQEEQRKLMAALGVIQIEGTVAIPDDMRIELIEASRSGTPGYFEMLKSMDGAIAKVVLSQSLTTEAAGGQYKAEVQKGVRNEVVRADSDLINDSFNRSVARWLTEWNFPNASPPKAVRITEEPEDLVRLSERDKNLVAMGFKPDQDYVRKTYGEGWSVATVADASSGSATNPAIKAAFAEPGGPATPLNDTPATQYASQALERFRAVLEGLLAQVRHLLEVVGDLGEAQERLFALYPEMDSAPLADLLTGAALATHMAGRHAVLVEAGVVPADHADVQYGGLPFKEAIDYFRGKVPVPTERWDDLVNGQHDVGFMSAGATKADLLNDLQSAMDRAIAEGTTLSEFRKSFDEAVAKHGWEYTGSRAWRSKLIFNTNMQNAYQAGRYAQMTDPDVLQSRPYWQYRHYASPNERKEHKAWNGLVLPAQDPWWSTHYPPNGFNCHCTVFTLASRDLRREGLSVGSAPRDSGGVDRGFAYAPGQVAAQAKGVLEEKFKLLPSALVARVRDELGWA